MGGRDIRLVGWWPVSPYAAHTPAPQREAARWHRRVAWETPPKAKAWRYFRHAQTAVTPARPREEAEEENKRKKRGRGG